MSTASFFAKARELEKAQLITAEVFTLVEDALRQAEQALLAGNEALAHCLLDDLNHKLQFQPKVGVIPNGNEAYSELPSVQAAANELVGITQDDITPDPDSAVMDEHDSVRWHLDNIYSHAVAGAVDEYGRQLHLGLSKQRQADDAAMAALFLLLSDGLESGLASGFLQAGQRAYKFAETALGSKQWGELNARAAEFAQDRLKHLDKVAEEIQTQVQKKVIEASRKLENMRQVLARTDAIIEEAKDTATIRAAMTEAQVAYGAAQYAVLSAQGVTHKRWITQRDERVRESHTMCEQQGAIKLGGTFHNGLRYPGDPNGGPEEIINCRCYLVGANYQSANSVPVRAYVRKGKVVSAYDRKGIPKHLYHECHKDDVASILAKGLIPTRDYILVGTKEDVEGVNLSTGDEDGPSSNLRDPVRLKIDTEGLEPSRFIYFGSGWHRYNGPIPTKHISLDS